MSLYGIFETDKEAEQKGFELCIQDNGSQITFWLARAGGANRKFASRMQELMRPHQHAASTNNMADETASGILCKALAEAVIIRWEGVTDRDGNEVEYTAAAAETLLKDLPDLRDLIFEEAKRASNFLAVEREIDSGN